MSTKRETWRRFWPPCAVLGMSAGLLVDFEGAAEKVKAMWPLVEALLPIFALGGTIAASIWLAGTIWEWWPSRQRKLKDVTALQALAPQILALAQQTRPHERQEYRILTDFLAELDISAVTDPKACRSFLEHLFVLAKRGELEKARNL